MVCTKSLTPCLKILIHKRNDEKAADRRKEDHMHNRSKAAILSALTNLVWFILTYFWNRPRVISLTGEELARAWGSSIKAAQQSAAEKGLEALKKKKQTNETDPA